MLPLAFADYNFRPNAHFREPLFFLMLYHDLLVPPNTLPNSQMRYLKTDDNIESLEALKNIYESVGHNLTKAQKRCDYISCTSN